MSTKDMILDALDERLADGAALLLKGHMEVALQRAEDQETAAAIWHLHRCRLTIPRGDFFPQKTKFQMGGTRAGRLSAFTKLERT